jgi:hypothetical protein
VGNIAVSGVLAGVDQKLHHPRVVNLVTQLHVNSRKNFFGMGSRSHLGYIFDKDGFHIDATKVL